MTSDAKVYIAGVGSSPWPPQGSPAKTVSASGVSAATKALLDAGVTYDDVAQGVTNVRSKTLESGSQVFKAFDEGGIPVNEVEHGSEFASSVYLTRNRGIRCVLMIAAEKVCFGTLSAPEISAGLGN